MAWFVPEPFQFLFGLFPPYWVSKAYWLALEGSPWWGSSLVLGIVLQVLLLLFLTRRFTKVIYHHT
jgi:fluoroquinolone transport system permease protein